MNVFLVSYDLMSPGRDYATLYGALKAFGGVRVLLSQWAVRTSLSAVQLRDHLRQYMDSNDRILVNNFTDWASYNTLIKLSDAA